MIGTVLNEARLDTSVEDYQAQLEKDKVAAIDFYAYFKEANKKLLKRQHQLWRAHKEKMLLCCLYYIGKQTVIRAPGGAFGYIPVPIAKDDPVYVLNYLRPYSDNVTAMGVQAQPEVMFAVLNPDDQQRRKALKVIRNIHAYYSQRHFTETFKHETWKYAQLCSTYHSEMYFDPDVNTGYEWVDTWTTEKMPGRSWMGCDACGAQMEGGDQASCQNCGALQLTPQQEPEQEIYRASGWFQKAGDIVLKFSSPLCQTYSLTTGAELSPYRYVEEDLPTEIIEHQWGKLDEMCRDSAWMDDEMLHPVRILRRAEADRRGAQGVDDRESTLLQRFWYEPEMLHFIKPQAPVKLPNGDVIPAGVRLSEYFPTGMRLTTVPGAKQFYEVEEESHKRRFKDGRYNVNPGQFVGGGIEDSLEGNRQANVLHSLDFTYARRNAMPAVVVDDSVFPNGNLFNRPDNTIRVKRSALENQSIDQSFAIMKAAERSFTLEPMMQRLHQSMQATTKSLIGSTTAPQGYSNTATGDRMEGEKQSTILNVSLGLNGHYIVQVSVERMLLAQRVFEKARLIHVLNSRTGEYEAQAFQAADIQHEFLVWLKPGSAIPVLPFERQQRLMAAAGLVGTLKSIGYDSPAVIRQVNEVCQVDFAFERTDEYEDACLADLEAMEALVPQAEQLLGAGAAGLLGGDVLAQAAEFLMQVAPVDVAAKGNEVRLNWFREWLASPQGRKAPESLKVAVRGLIDQLLQAVQIERAQIAQLAAIGAGMLPPPSLVAPMLPEMQQQGKVPDNKQRPQGGTNGQTQENSAGRSTARSNSGSSNNNAPRSTNS